MKTVVKSARQLLSADVAILLNGKDANETSLSNWNRAKTRLCADGALQRVKEYSLCKPTHVVGDFDSISPDLLNEYEIGGGFVKKIDCQNSTDFQKCLQVIEHDIKYCGDIVVSLGLGGRRDHEHLNLRTAVNTTPSNIILAGSCSVIHPLRPGLNIINIETPYDSGVGILPLLGPTMTTTKGLKWDLNGVELGYHDSLMWTSSNEPISDVVEVTVDRPALWTISLSGS
eukprot:TRINITY_DN8139_c0_g1_i1.p1 TRINITY_DN8139_c0_g1~~TRINITY_DN8139_c0_g1_i1.p1  ORF type:complete len:229 (+),score=33.62 TRINITY_DN8139_c0_g1_i1:127-813(+)